MEVNKVIKFYELSPNPSIGFAEINGTKLIAQTCNIFLTAFPQEDYYNFDYNGKNLFFDVISINNKEMFGCCSEEEKITPTSFVRQRNRNTNEITPLKLSPDEQLETYTYFYIDFLRNKMAVIINKKISKISDIIEEFIWQKSNNIASITIRPEKIQNMKEAYKRFGLLKELEIEYSRKPSLEDIPNLKSTLTGECEVDKYRINLKLNVVKPSLINKLVDYKQSNTENVSSLKLLAKNELGLDETINFFEAIYSKTVPIELTDDTVLNLDYIETLLKRTLENIYKNLVNTDI